MIRREFWAPVLFAACVTVMLAGCSDSPNGNSGGDGDKPAGGDGNADESTWILHAQPNPNATAAYKWVDILEEAAARRIDKVGARPPIIAREMGIVCQAMYDAWAAYDTTAVGYIYDEKISPLPSLPSEIETARHEAISYAAYRVLRSRFSTGAGAATTLANLDAKLTELGYSPAVAQGAVTKGD